jgi:hypothetical protein
MATRSTIAIEYANGTVEQVYCHWDGYLSNNGKILITHYRDAFKLEQMIRLGDISSLGAEIGEKHDFDDRCDDCTFYGRDRGEKDVGPKLFQSFEDYKANHQYEEYEYIYRNDGEWYVSIYGKDYVPLAGAIADEMIQEEMAEDE